MIDYRLQKTFDLLCRARLATPGSAVQTMLVNRTIPKMAADRDTTPKARAYLYKELARLQSKVKLGHADASEPLRTA